jgi:hypothetical protein
MTATVVERSEHVTCWRLPDLTYYATQGATPPPVTSGGYKDLVTAKRKVEEQA